MFPKFIQVGLYSGGGRIYREGTYIWDVNWVSYFGAYIPKGLIYGGTGGVLTGF